MNDRQSSSAPLSSSFRWIAAITFAAATLSTSYALSADADAGKWNQLFNGRDLSGWTPKISHYKLGENYADTFRVEDGILRITYDKYQGDFGDRFGHLFYDESFSNYILRFEYRFVGQQHPGGPDWAYMNSGLMLHGQTPESMTRDQSFPVSLEVQLIGSGKHGDRTTGNLCTIGTAVTFKKTPKLTDCYASTSSPIYGDTWVTAEAEVHGGRLIRHKINGQNVLEYTDARLDPNDGDAKRLIDAGANIQLSSGTVSIQSESHPVEFRKIELMKLDK
jgi:hypothetical protein